MQTHCQHRPVRFQLPIFLFLTFTVGLTFFPSLAKTQGVVRAWGDNIHGQFGNGTGNSSLIALTTLDPVSSASFTNAMNIAAGDAHSVALKTDGTVWAWGAGGLVGDGTESTRTIPVPVKSPDGINSLSGITAIVCGYYHSLALQMDGKVLSWGANSSGQLGDGSNSPRLLPVQVKGVDSIGSLTEVVSISAGDSHSLALKSDGTVWTWGFNHKGQLGDGTTNTHFTPVQVRNSSGIGVLDSVIAVAGGAYHSLALKSDGTVWAWGENNKGQLGDGTNGDHLLPVQVKDATGVGNLTGIIAIHCGRSHNIALRVDGTVWTWGYNEYGQLGDGTKTNRSFPVQVKGVDGVGTLNGITSLATGFYHSTALQADGTVLAWGNGYTIIPSLVKGERGIGILDGISTIASGANHGIALKRDGTSWAWGSNPYGQLGNGTTYYGITPTQIKSEIKNLSGIVSIAAGMQYTTALKADGTVWTWGDNFFGQLGDDTFIDSITPLQVKGSEGVGVLTNIVAIANASNHTLALKSNGTVWTWGINDAGELGDGTIIPGAPYGKSTPVQVKGYNGAESLTDVMAISAGSAHSIALKSDGTVWTWGGNYFGQLGDGTSTNRITPVQVRGVGGIGVLTNIVAVAGGGPGFGGNSTIALKADGTVWAWGSNYYGQLGDGTTTDRLSPVQVKGPDGVGFLTGIVAVGCGELHTIAVKSDGTVWTWGKNNEGQLGDGTLTNYSTPVQVRGNGGAGFLSNILSAAGGQSHTVTLKLDGTVWTWGTSYDGALGDGTTRPHSTPVQALGITSAIAIDSGWHYSLALEAENPVRGNVHVTEVARYSQKVRFAFRPVGGGETLVRETYLPFSGNVLLTDVLAGTYDVAIKGANTLQKVVPNVNTTGGVNFGTVTLLPGDATGDNSVNFDDFLALADAYFTVNGDALYDPQADFNTDGEVNFDDFLLLADNYFTDGEE